MSWHLGFFKVFHALFAQPPRAYLMSLQCRLCGFDISHSIFRGRNPWGDVDYYECSSCGYVQTQQPTWLSAAYENPINASDTGIMVRNLANLNLVISTLALLRCRRQKVVDCAGGYGILVRMLRDKGFDAYWNDLYSSNLLSKGFEFSGGEAGLVTAFEAFEHFLYPLNEAKKLNSISANILISTELIPAPTPLPSQWWYYGLEHGQHIGFFRVETLKYLAHTLGLNLLTDGRSLHLLSKKKLSLRKWNLLRRIARLSPSLLTRGLTPKTWSDHLTMADSPVM
jgi:hypothetical protein